MAIPILTEWTKYYEHPHEGLGSTYERFVVNRMLLGLCRAINAKNVLEAPIFGFSGISGINSAALAQAGLNVALCEHDARRAALVEQTWEHDLALPVKVRHTPGYNNLPFTKEEFDLAWSFFALWFVPDLAAYFAELKRTVKKAVLICVPNRGGLGYKFLASFADDPDFYREHVNPQVFIPELEKQGFKLVDNGFIDCPPWPDTFMAKEDLAAKVGITLPRTLKPQKPLTIMDWYRGGDPGMQRKIMRYTFVETWAPDWFKGLWAHHRWYLFLKNEA